MDKLDYFIHVWFSVGYNFVQEKAFNKCPWNPYNVLKSLSQKKYQIAWVHDTCNLIVLCKHTSTSFTICSQFGFKLISFAFELGWTKFPCKTILSYRVIYATYTLILFGSVNDEFTCIVFFFFEMRHFFQWVYHVRAVMNLKIDHVRE